MEKVLESRYKTITCDFCGREKTDYVEYCSAAFGMAVCEKGHNFCYSHDLDEIYKSRDPQDKRWEDYYIISCEEDPTMSVSYTYDTFAGMDERNRPLRVKAEKCPVCTK